MSSLPDFSKCIELQDLLFDMGIKSVQPLPELEFVKTKYKIVEKIIDNSELLHFSELLKLKSIDICKNDLEFDEDGLIHIGGCKCCIYIKNQNKMYWENGISNYRFHLCNCKTIQEMTDDGRRGRYVATSRDDGKFEINIYSSGVGVYPLSLCHNCIAQLKNVGKYDTPFSLKNFYKKYQSEIPAEIKMAEQVPYQEKYAPDHKEIADRYKKELHYICQKCGVDCSEHRELLHMHHVDGEGQNNIPSNLRFLCVACHAKQPRHQHMYEKFAEQIKRVEILRKEQGLIMLNI